MKKKIRFRFYYLICAILFATVSFTGCNSAIPGNVKNEKLQIVTTIFPIYDWTLNVLGANPADAEVTMLLDNGVDLHSFQPTATDIMKISGCDVFIYVGGESDAWVDDALSEAVNKDMKVINLMEVLGSSVKEEELVEGMQEDEHDHEDGEEGHDHEEGHNHEEEHEEEEGYEGEDNHEDGHHHEETEYDEHIWLSLRNAGICTDAIADAVAAADSENKELYLQNAKEYKEKLTNLDERYKEAVEDGSVKTLLFGDRFPFRYLVDDYGLDYYAAFIGCSAETEASFETVTFLSEKMDELELNNIMIIEGSDGKIAETVVSNTRNKNQNIRKLDSMQSVTAADVSGGENYLSIMEKNLEVLKEALQ